MAARRLILVMLVLLVISTVIAMITPQPGSEDPATSDSSATGASGSSGASGAGGTSGTTGASGASGADGADGAGGSAGSDTPTAGRDRSVAGGQGDSGAGAASGSGEPGPERLTRIVPATGPPEMIVAAPGKRIVVIVKVKVTSDIEIADLGRLETATPYAPARFDLVLPISQGRFAVTEPSTGTERAVILSSG